MSNAVQILSLIIDGMQAVNQISASLTSVAQLKARAEAEGRDVSDAELAAAKAMVEVSSLKLKALIEA